MMHSVSVSLLINAMPRQVFEAVADPRKPFLTSNPFTHLEVVGHQQSGKGTIYRWRFTLPFGIQFQFDEIVTEWIEPERFTYHAITGWKMEATNLITPENGRTRIHFTLRYLMPGIMRWLFPKWLMRLGILRSLRDLKRRVEPPKRKSQSQMI